MNNKFKGKKRKKEKGKRASEKNLYTINLLTFASLRFICYVYTSGDVNCSVWITKLVRKQYVLHLSIETTSTSYQMWCNQTDRLALRADELNHWWFRDVHLACWFAHAFDSKQQFEYLQDYTCSTKSRPWSRYIFISEKAASVAIHYKAGQYPATSISYVYKSLSQFEYRVRCFGSSNNLCYSL